MKITTTKLEIEFSDGTVGVFSEATLKWLLFQGRQATPKGISKARSCWNNCGAQIQFRSTPAAPKGAWVDEGTVIHHRCKRRKAPKRRKLKEAQMGPAPA